MSAQRLGAIIINWCYIQPLNRKTNESQLYEHTCFVYGSFNSNRTQFGCWYCRQAAFEGAHWGSDRADNDDFLKPDIYLHYCM